MTVALSILFTIAVVVGYWFYGRGSVWGPLVALAAQGFFAGLIILDGSLSMWPGWIAITGIQLWNLVRWSRSRAQAKGDR